MNKLEDKIVNALDLKRPFVMFRKPNADAFETVFQQNGTTYYTSDFLENGFVFAPFNPDEKALLIPFSNADMFLFAIDKTMSFSESEIKKSTSENEKKQHEKLIQKGINFIINSAVDKIVLSRKELIETDNCTFFEMFQKLLFKYPTAYVYFWYHPVSGIWMGATPELLLSAKNKEFKTIALASTQEFKGTLDVNWNEKEMQEHQFVIDYIVLQLVNYKLKISETKTVKAGNLVHLRADISGEISTEKLDLKNLIYTLHPTPATCGMPKEKARQFILQNEHYNRSYYTGFLGEIGSSKIDVYVNLRCMKIEQQQPSVKKENQKHQVSLYIGGGITKDSIPNSEWQETVAKAKVMKKVL